MGTYYVEDNSYKNYIHGVFNNYPGFQNQYEVETMKNTLDFFDRLGFKMLYEDFQDLDDMDGYKTSYPNLDFFWRNK